jgi:hypothetical protein
MPEFSGQWWTTYGPMDLTQKGDRIDGTYGGVATIHGVLRDGRLVFRYQEPNAAGEGWFERRRYGKFTGRWRADGDPVWRDWTGVRGYDGIWDTTYGLMRLFHHDDHIHGFYEGVGSASLTGQLDGDRFVFRYQEPNAAGEGWFSLDDGDHFHGEWRPQGAAQSGGWTGRRIQPIPGLRWLVVLEAHWQRSLYDEEYSFGEMLTEFFARVKGVKVRHRFFNNESSLEKWCHELMYLAEPTILSIATHGTQQGLVAHGRPIAPRVLVEPLQWADNVQLVHFSACLMMHDGPSGELARALHQAARLPVSGYTTSVDWAESAILEFTYFDLMLARGLDPAAAAGQVYRLLNFAGDDGFPEVGFRGAGFRLLG